jgi:hypothetical protein
MYFVEIMQVTRFKHVVPINKQTLRKPDGNDTDGDFIVAIIGEWQEVDAHSIEKKNEKTHSVIHQQDE